MYNGDSFTETTKLLAALKDRLELMHQFADSFIEIGDEYSLHQFRVYSRRSHTITLILGKLTKNLNIKEFGKWIRKGVRPSNHLRDLDVALLYFKDESNTNRVGSEFYHYLLFQRAKNFKKVQEKLREITSSGKFDSIDNLFKISRNNRLVSDINRQLEKGKRRLQKRAGLFNQNPSQKSIHEMRMAIKRYRYLLESIDHDQKIIKLCKRIQEYIGLIHDREVQLNIFLSWMNGRFYTSDTLLVLNTGEKTNRFSTSKMIEDYVAQFDNLVPTEECRKIAESIISNRNTIYKEFLIFWKSEEVTKSTLFN